MQEKIYVLIENTFAKDYNRVVNLLSSSSSKETIEKQKLQLEEEKEKFIKAQDEISKACGDLNVKFPFGKFISDEEDQKIHISRRNARDEVYKQISEKYSIPVDNLFLKVSDYKIQEVDFV